MLCCLFILGQPALAPLQDVASLGILAEKLEGDKAVLERQLAEAREAQVRWFALVPSSCYGWVQCIGNAGALAGEGTRGAGDMAVCD